MASVLINGYKGSIYPENGGYTGVLDLGFLPTGKRNRPKRKGRNKAIVKDKLTRLANEIDNKIKTSRANTVLKVVTDYVDELERSGKAPGTISRYRTFVRAHISKIGAVKVHDLEPSHVAEWLVTVSKSVCSETLRQIHGLLSRALDRAIVHRMGINHNVSRPVVNIQGESEGRESKSFTPEQVKAILITASVEVPRQRFGAYVILALTSGLRPDEMNGLLWESVDMEEGTVSVVRADRYKGRVKTKNSVRTVSVADIALAALSVWRKIQDAEFEAIGATVTPKTPVFTQADGSPYVATSARKEFRKILKVAGIKDPSAWTLRETRTTFVSIMSYNDVPIHEIADMCGNTVKIIERHYRKVLKPVQRRGAQVVNRVFSLAA